MHHINGDKSDNRIENLELTSRSAHTTAHQLGHRLTDEAKNKISQASKGRPHKWQRKLSDEDVLFIRKHYVKNDRQYGLRALARRFGVNHATIYSILQGQTYSEGIV